MIDVDIEGVESVMRILHYDSDDQSIPLVFLDQILLDPNRFQQDSWTWTAPTNNC